jgi:hypothetical protein
MLPVQLRVLHIADGVPKGKTAPANVCPDPDSEVWGVLYKITRRQMLRLNLTEGVPGKVYRTLPKFRPSSMPMKAVGACASPSVISS